MIQIDIDMPRRCEECPLCVDYDCIIHKRVTDEYYDGLNEQYAHCPLTMPSAQADLQPTCNQLATDCISRQDAIDALAKKMPSWTTPDGSGEFDHDIQITDEAFVDCMQIINELPSAQPEQRWIPVTERLPEYDKPVLLSTAWGKTEIGFWTQRGWMIVACSYREFEQSAVTAWMPLPEPYAERRQE